MNFDNIDFTRITEKDLVIESKILRLVDEHIDEHIRNKFNDFNDQIRNLCRAVILSDVIPNIVNRLLSGKG